MSEARTCVVDGGALSPRYASESFTMNTPIGSRLRSWMTAWACADCGLLYDPALMPDPRIEAERVAHEAEERRYSKRTTESLRKDPMWQKLKANRAARPGGMPAQEVK